MRACPSQPLTKNPRPLPRPQFPICEMGIVETRCVTLKLFFFFLIYLAASGLTVAKELMWILPGPGSEPHVPCIARLILYH